MAKGLSSPGCFGGGGGAARELPGNGCGGLGLQLLQEFHRETNTLRKGLSIPLRLHELGAFPMGQGAAKKRSEVGAVFWTVQRRLVEAFREGGGERCTLSERGVTSPDAGGALCRGVKRLKSSRVGGAALLACVTRPRGWVQAAWPEQTLPAGTTGARAARPPVVSFTASQGRASWEGAERHGNNRLERVALTGTCWACSSQKVCGCSIR